MIIWVIIALALILIGTITLINARALRWISSLIVAGLLLLAVGAVSANMSSHWGMHVETSTHTKRIYSAGSKQSPVSLLITKQVGTNSGRYVMMYKTHVADAKAAAHFVPDTDDTINAVKQKATYRRRNVKQATVTTTTKKWVWQSKAVQFWLQVGDSHNQLISRRSVVTVPRETWLVLTTSQAKRLGAVQAKMTTNQAQTAQLKVVIGQKVAQYQQQHPTASQRQIEQYTNKQTAKVTIQQLKKLLD